MNSSSNLMHRCMHVLSLTVTHTSSFSHAQSNYSRRTLPERCAPGDLVLGQIDEALYRLSRSNNSYLALITERPPSVSARLGLFSTATKVTTAAGVAAAVPFNLNNKKVRLSYPPFLVFLAPIFDVLLSYEKVLVCVLNPEARLMI